MTKRKQPPIATLRRKLEPTGERTLAPDQLLAKAFLKQAGSLLTPYTLIHQPGCPKHGYRAHLVMSVACCCQPRLFDGDGVEFTLDDK